MHSVHSIHHGGLWKMPSWHSSLLNYRKRFIFQWFRGVIAISKNKVPLFSLYTLVQNMLLALAGGDNLARFYIAHAFREPGAAIKVFPCVQKNSTLCGPSFFDGWRHAVRITRYAYESSIHIFDSVLECFEFSMVGKAFGWTMFVKALTSLAFLRI